MFLSLEPTRHPISLVGLSDSAKMMAVTYESSACSISTTSSGVTTWSMLLEARSLRRTRRIFTLFKPVTAQKSSNLTDSSKIYTKYTPVSNVKEEETPKANYMLFPG
ncbi:hypothetical protein J6590_000142 [Homalodisca vitripennis]|nr:hypothetical protein J6590_000142 [Homalodisca vitripennis]